MSFTAATLPHTDRTLLDTNGRQYILRVFESFGIRPQIVVQTQYGNIAFRIGETTDYHGLRTGLEAVCDGFHTNRYKHTFYTSVMKTATDWQFGDIRREDAAYGNREATKAARMTIREEVGEIASAIMLHPLLIGELESETRRHTHRAAIRELTERKAELEAELAHVNAQLAELVK